MHILYAEQFEHLGDLADCCSSGDVSDSVEYVCTRYASVLDEIPQDAIVRCLSGYGAWDDLETVDRDTLNQRLVFAAAPSLVDDGMFAIE
jgi:hypothetical protein